MVLLPGPFGPANIRSRGSVRKSLAQDRPLRRTPYKGDPSMPAHTRHALIPATGQGRPPFVGMTSRPATTSRATPASDGPKPAKTGHVQRGERTRGGQNKTGHFRTCPRLQRARQDARPARRLPVPRATPRPTPAKTGQNRPLHPRAGHQSEIGNPPIGNPKSVPIRPIRVIRARGIPHPGQNRPKPANCVPIRTSTFALRTSAGPCPPWPRNPARRPKPAISGHALYSGSGAAP
jgi:hypothetical protein